MFIDFFYNLKNVGIPVSPTAFLTLHRALKLGLVNSLNDFYIASRSILVKSERYFDRFDRVFAHHFEGAALPDDTDLELEELVHELLRQWLQNPRLLAVALGVEEAELQRWTPAELIAYFKARLREQTGAHHGGSRWIGTGGTSPVGHSGRHPGGMRVGGVARGRTAVKVALDRRYRDYALSGPLTRPMVGEALKRLRNLVLAGPRDQVDIDATIYRTVRSGGEIEIVYARSLRDRLKVILAVDNGGYSMDPHVPVVQTLFDYARFQFKDLKCYFFHNTIYSTLWQDPARFRRPVRIDSLAAADPQTRVFIVGDASMAPFELMVPDGSLQVEARSGRPSIACLKFLAQTFPYTVWLNPVPVGRWDRTRTIGMIRQIFPMFELSIDGLEKAVDYQRGVRRPS